MTLASAALRRAEPLCIPAAAAVLRRRAASIGSVDELVDFVLHFRSFGVSIAPWQVASELRGFLSRAAEARPAAVLEIGTAAGGTFFGLAHVAEPDALLVSVDLPGGEFGGGYPRSRGHLYRRFARQQQRIELIRGDSHASETVEAVRTALAGRPLDVLFIDGDHSYDGVASDFAAYGPLVRQGGLIGFHDIVAQPDTGVERGDLAGDVPVFWQDVRGDYPYEEIVADYSGGFGIGVLRWSSSDARLQPADELPA